MAYTHYLKRKPELDRVNFLRAVDDARFILEELRKRGMLIRGPSGEGLAELSDDCIAFNGQRDCGHRYIDLGQPWPAPDAQGVEDGPEPIVGTNSWFSGALLNTRICGGSCAAGPFVVDREWIVRPWDRLEKGRYSWHCTTDFKPYDLAVTAVLVRLKERMPEEVSVQSDGLEPAFRDAKRLCRELFGWSSRFVVESIGGDENSPGLGQSVDNPGHREDYQPCPEKEPT